MHRLGRSAEGAAGAASQQTWDPALHPPLIIEISSPEHLLKTRFVLEHTAVKPKRACGEQDQREPRGERHRQAQHENQVPEIHRVANVTIRPGLDDAIRRHPKSGTAAAHAIAKTPDQQILQISPGEQHKSLWLDGELSVLPHELECDHKQRTKNECLHRRSAEPAKQSRASHPRSASAGASQSSCRSTDSMSWLVPPNTSQTGKSTLHSGR